MPLIKGLFERRAIAGAAGNPANPTYWLLRAFAGEETQSGRRITTEGALNFSAVWACVRILAETVGTLPVQTYRRLPDGGKERATSHPLYRLLHDRPNPKMTAAGFFTARVTSLALWGNAYSEIVWGLDGHPIELWPIRPDHIRVKDAGTELLYTYTGTGVDRPVPARNILHDRLFSPTGGVGYSPIAYQREAIGLGLAAEEYGARFFANDARPGGVLKHPSHLSDKAALRLKAEWESLHRGGAQSHRVAVLEEGIEWQSISMPMADAQFLETRKFQRSEIAAIFRVPPHLMGDLERSTNNNIEHQGIEFVTYTIRPYIVAMEQEHNRQLLTAGEQGTVFTEFLVDSLLRGDLQSRYAAYAIGRNWGWLSADDVRGFENMNPLPDDAGQHYMVPLNMVDATQMSEPAMPAMPAAPPPAREALPAPEVRTIGSSSSRLALSRRYHRIIEDRAAAIVRAEANDIRQAAERHLATRDLASWEVWLAHYAARQPATIEKVMRATFHAYGETMAEDAAAEIDGRMPADLDQFTREYTKDFAGSYAGRTAAQLRIVVAAAAEAGSEPLPAIVQRLDEWREKRAGKVADTEAVKLANATTKHTWRTNGIKKLRWVAVGKNCPYCSRLNGKIVGIEHDFVGEGEDVAGAEGDRPLTARRRIGHPPIHGACNCQIAPG